MQVGFTVCMYTSPRWQIFSWYVMPQSRSVLQAMRMVVEVVDCVDDVVEEELEVEVDEVAVGNVTPIVVCVAIVVDATVVEVVDKLEVVVACVAFEAGLNISKSRTTSNPMLTTAMPAAA